MTLNRKRLPEVGDFIPYYENNSTYSLHIRFLTLNFAQQQKPVACAAVDL